MHASPITPTPAGEPIVLQLPPGAALIDLPGPLGHGWLVVEGALRLDTDTSTGGPVQLALPGDSVGFERLFEQASPYAARAVVPTRLHALPAPAQATDGIERARDALAMHWRRATEMAALRTGPVPDRVKSLLVLLATPGPGQDTHALPGLREIALQFISLGTEKELREQLVAVTLERTCLMEPLPAEESAFAARREAARGRILLVAQEILRLVGTILGEHGMLAKKLAAMQKAFPQAAADIAAQLAELMPKRFIVATPFERLQHYPRYLKAIALRLDKAKNDPARDTRLMADWQALGKPWERERNAMLKGGQPHDAFLDEFRWLLEELRVALFAQELKTSSPVSVKRLQKMWEGRER